LDLCAYDTFFRVKLIFLNRYFHPDISATSQMLSGLAFHLAAQGAKVHVITSRQRYDDAGAQLAKSENVGGVEVHRVRTSRFGRQTLPGRALDYASYYLCASLELARIAKRGDIVIAKTDPPLISVPAALVARLRGARLVNWLQDIFPEIAERTGMRFGFAAGVIRFLRNVSLRSAAVNVVLGERMRALVQAIPGVLRTEVIHNSADGETIVPIAMDSNALRRQWGLAGKFVVAYSGNMGRAHEFETILGAAEALRSDGRIVFLFVGGGHQREWIANETEKRNLPNMMFQPYQPFERLSESLGAADLHLTTLLAALEGVIVPSKIYGILAAGRPVLHVGDPEGEIAAIVESAQAGFTIPAGNPAMLATRILEFASVPALAATFGRNARKAFDERYNQRIAFERWARILLSVDSGALG
jgi:colanic acid biosynthesis glycosyl transferase WcaI